MNNNLGLVCHFFCCFYSILLLPAGKSKLSIFLSLKISDTLKLSVTQGRQTSSSFILLSISPSLCPPAGWQPEREQGPYLGRLSLWNAIRNPSRADGGVGWDAVRETERRERPPLLPVSLLAFEVFRPSLIPRELVIRRPLCSSSAQWRLERAGWGGTKEGSIRQGWQRGLDRAFERRRCLHVFLLPSRALWAPAICGRSDRFWWRVSRLFPAVIHLTVAAGHFSVSLALPLCLSFCLSLIIPLFCFLFLFRRPSLYTFYICKKGCKMGGPYPNDK